MTRAATTAHPPSLVRGDDPPTPGQLQALHALAAGLMLAEAARDLGVAPRTLTQRLCRLYARLGLTAAQTLIVAGAKGWITVERAP